MKTGQEDLTNWSDLSGPDHSARSGLLQRKKKPAEAGFLMMKRYAVCANLRLFRPMGVMMIRKIINAAAIGYLMP
jgi:hypothetical protein